MALSYPTQETRIHTQEMTQNQRHMQQVHTKQGMLSYRAYGDARMPTLVLLMGLGMPALAWPKAFLERLVRKGLHVLIVDNRDSGAAQQYPQEVTTAKVFASIMRYIAGGTVTAPYRLEDMAADVEELLDVLGIERAHIAGISMGGMIAQVFATQAPHRTITLTCLSSATGNARTGLGNLRAIRMALQSPRGHDRESLKRHYRNLMRVIGTPGSDYPDEVLDAIIDIGLEHHIDASAQARQLMAILASGDRRAQLRQLLVPTLIIHGRADPLLPYRAGVELAECIEGARLLTIDGMGHDLPIKQLETIAEAIAEHCYSKTLR